MSITGSSAVVHCTHNDENVHEMSEELLLQNEIQQCANKLCIPQVVYSQ